MKYYRQIVLSTFLLLVLMASTSFAMPADVQQTISINEQNNGQTIQLRQFDTLNLSLNGNPTTGYIWQITAVNPEILPLQNHNYTANSQLIGSAGVDVFSFKAQSAGTCQLSLTYGRPFEANPIKLYSVMVQITSYTDGPAAKPSPAR